MAREKNPAAVEMGKRRQAKMTAEERAKFISAGAAAAAKTNSRRTPEERRRIARKAALTRRMRPKWLTAQKNAEMSCLGAQGRQPQPAAHADPEPLEQQLDQVSDDLLEELYSALARRFGA
jgi:hypothetical protein